MYTVTNPPISTKPTAKSLANTGFRRCPARLRRAARTLAGFGVKNRDRGTSTANTAVPASVMREHASRATRQVPTWTTTDGTIRPASPPIVVPAM
ncbi:hypothetical protein MOKP122_13820 [Mycobacterium avium subsp. hominissuis]